MSKLYLTYLLLQLTLTVNAQDTLSVELWDNNRVKRVKHFGMVQNRLMIMEDSLFYTDGTLWETRIYNPSSKTFLLTCYDTHGNPELIIPLNEKGNMNGLFTKKYLDGQKSEEGMYSDGKKEGKWIYWYPSGKLEKEIIFKMNFPDTEMEWWENGNKRKVKDSTETVIWYHENGQKKTVMTKNKEGESYTYWDERGMKREESISKGYEIVLLNAWDEKGKQTVAKGNGYIDMLDGELNIPMRIYYKKGKRLPNKP